MILVNNAFYSAHPQLVELVKKYRVSAVVILLPSRDGEIPNATLPYV